MIPTTISTSSPRVRMIPDVVEAPGAANERPPGILDASPWASAGRPDAGAPCSDVATVVASVAVGGRERDTGDAIEDEGTRKPWIAAIGPDGQPYAGDLLADILEYRVLRSKQLFGIALDVVTSIRLGALERRLRSRPDPGSARREARAYHRYACRFPAKVVSLRRSQAHPVEVRDVSAGGVKIAPAPADLDAGDAVWLELEGSVMVPARVAWMRDGCAGLMFAGAPRQR